MPTLDLSLPNLDHALLDPPTGACLASAGTSRHAPRFLLLYGSLRDRSYSKLLTLEAARLLIAMGGEVRMFDPTGLPLPDSEPETHPKVQELREAAAWSEGMVWTSPERHVGSMPLTLPRRQRLKMFWVLIFMDCRASQSATACMSTVRGASPSNGRVRTPLSLILRIITRGE